MALMTVGHATGNLPFGKVDHAYSSTSGSGKDRLSSAMRKPVSILGFY